MASAKSVGWIREAAQSPRFAGVCLVCLTAMTVLLSSTAFGLWLPWATEQDKVKKAVEDIWKALLDNDRAALEKLLTGPGVKQFVDNQALQIKQLGVKNYTCTFKDVKIDQINGVWAWVTYERAATLADGTHLPAIMQAVFQRVNGDWKLVTGLKSKRAIAREQENKRRAAKTGDKEEEEKKLLEAITRGLAPDELPAEMEQ